MNETLLRSLSGLVYVLLLVFATLFCEQSFLVLFGLLMLQTVLEFSRIIKLPISKALVLAVLSYLALVLLPIPTFFLMLLIIVSAIILLALVFWLFKDQSNFKPFFRWGLLITYIITPFIAIVNIATVFGKFIPSIIISIFLLIWTNDSFAYLVGKSIGKTKLFESISPKKTIEGFIGGLLFTILAAILISKYYVNHIDLLQWITIGVLVSILGTLGDLVQSKFKRYAKVKDSGSIMPGHGGIYDRLDSVIFVAPFLYLFFKIISYVS